MRYIDGEYVYEIGDSVIVYDEYSCEWCGAKIIDTKDGYYVLDASSNKISNHIFQVCFEDLKHWNEAVNTLRKSNEEFSGKYGIDTDIVYYDFYDMPQPGHIHGHRYDENLGHIYNVKMFSGGIAYDVRESEITQWKEKFESGCTYKIGDCVDYPDKTNTSISGGEISVEFVWGKYLITRIRLVCRDETKEAEIMYTLTRIGHDKNITVEVSEPQLYLTKDIKKEYDNSLQTKSTGNT